MNPALFHHARSMDPSLEPYEVEHHKRQAARHLNDPEFWDSPTDVVRTLGEAAEALDPDDLTPLSDSDLAALLSRVDIALGQITAEADRRHRRRP